VFLCDYVYVDCKQKWENRMLLPEMGDRVGGFVVRKGV